MRPNSVLDSICNIVGIILINVMYYLQWLSEQCCDELILRRGSRPDVLGSYTRNGYVNNKPSYNRDRQVQDMVEGEREQLYLYLTLEGRWMVNENKWSSEDDLP